MISQKECLICNPYRSAGYESAGLSDCRAKRANDRKGGEGVGGSKNGTYYKCNTARREGRVVEIDRGIREGRLGVASF